MKELFLFQFSMNYLCFLNTIGPPFFFIYSCISTFLLICLLQQRTTQSQQQQQQQKSLFMTILSRGKSLIIQPSSATHKLKQQYDNTINQTTSQNKNETSLLYYMMVPKSWFIYYYIIAWINFALLQASWIIVLNQFRILKKNQTISSTFDQGNLKYDHNNHHQSTVYFHQLMQTSPNRNNDINIHQYDDDYDTVSLCNIVILFLYGVHISRRLYENLFIHCHASTKSRMNVIVVIGGILFYIFIPSSLLSLPNTCFNIKVDNDSSIDGLFINHRYHGINHIQKLNNNNSNNNGTTSKTTSFSYFYLIALWIISMLNIVFQFEQYHHHVILSNLRKRKQIIMNNSRHQNTANAHHHHTNNDYPIPMGGLFYYVSCPHYLFEILIYSTFGMLLFLDHYGIDNKPKTIDIMQLYRNQMIDNRLLSSLYVSSSTAFGIILSFIFQYRFFMTFAFIVSNLIYSATEYHNWYQNTYGIQYKCLNRDCIIPGIV